MHSSNISCLFKVNVEIHFSMTFLCCFFIFLGFEIACCSGHSCLGMPHTSNEIDSVSPRCELFYLVCQIWAARALCVTERISHTKRSCQESQFSCETAFRTPETPTTPGQDAAFEHIPSRLWHFCTETSQELQNCHSRFGQGYWEVARVEMSPNSELIEFLLCVCVPGKPKLEAFHMTPLWDSDLWLTYTYIFALWFHRTWNWRKVVKWWEPFNKAPQLL